METSNTVSLLHSEPPAQGNSFQLSPSLEPAKNAFLFKNNNKNVCVRYAKPDTGTNAQIAALVLPTGNIEHGKEGVWEAGEAERPQSAEGIADNQSLYN